MLTAIDIDHPFFKPLLVLSPTTEAGVPTTEARNFSATSRLTFVAAFGKTRAEENLMVVSKLIDALLFQQEMKQKLFN